MKKQILTIASLALFVGAVILSGCKKDDTTAPVITLTGDKTVVVTFMSATSYADPGATATDDQDGTITVVVTGTVNMASAGDYTLTYTATDAAGNSATETRTVTVNAGPYLAASYTVHDYTDTPTYSDNGTYPESITSSSVTNNKINFTKFAFYTNATAYATISGTTITVPSQTITCGVPTAADRNFTGTGTFTTSPPYTVTINYTEVTNGTTSTGHGVYTKL